MSKLKSYTITAHLFARAFVIYLRLNAYLKKEYIQNLHFPDDVKKDYFYHSSYYNRGKQYLHANHFFGELLSIIRGKKLDKEEMKNFAFLSSCAPIFDDFFEDDVQLNHIQQLMMNPVLKDAKNNKEILSVHFFSSLLQNTQHKADLLKSANGLFAAQIKSKTQKKLQLNNQELLNISIEKGGYSGLMYACLTNGKKDKNFKDLSYLLGSYGQLMDDIFDLYDDANDGIRTFANQALSCRDIRFILEEHEQKIQSLIFKTNLRTKDALLFNRVLVVFSSIIEIALQQYEQIEIQEKAKPCQCLQLERKKWIIDMEKASNIWKLFKFSAQRMT